MTKPLQLLALILVVLVGALVIVRGVRAGGPDDGARDGAASLKVARGAFVRTLRMTGLVESIHFYNVAAPRLIGATGPGSNTLIITKTSPGWQGSSFQRGSSDMGHLRQTTACYVHIAAQTQAPAQLIAGSTTNFFNLPGTFPGHAVDPRRELREFRPSSASSVRGEVRTLGCSQAMFFVD